MRKRIFIGAIGMLVIFIVVTTAVIYAGNWTIEKLLKNEGKILEVIPIGEGNAVLLDIGNGITAVYVEKGILRWKIKGRTDYMLKEDREDSVSTTSDIGGLITPDKSHYLIFGYKTNRDIKMVRFQTDDFDIRYKVHSYYWFIPVNEPINGFKANQFSFILTNSKEVFYPFD